MIFGSYCIGKKNLTFSVKSNLSLQYIRCIASSLDESISTSQRLQAIQVLLKKWCKVASRFQLVFDLTGSIFESQTSRNTATGKNELPLDQLTTVKSVVENHKLNFTKPFFCLKCHKRLPIKLHSYGRLLTARINIIYLFSFSNCDGHLHGRRLHEILSERSRRTRSHKNQISAVVYSGEILTRCSRTTATCRSHLHEVVDSCKELL